jgi:hypothetical protein
MLHTQKTDQAYKLLKSYARTKEQKRAVDETYLELLDMNSNEDRVIIYVLDLILNGLCFGNWFWNMPPNAKKAPTSPFGPRKVPRKVTTTEPRRSRGTGDMNKGQW